MTLFSELRLSTNETKATLDPNDLRNPFERDFDRVLFSAPVRRLADKTQVFPLEKNDSVRTRLTHSHEVANLCRSLTIQILRENNSIFDLDDALAVAPVVAATVGLAHDLGNPPFGHQGEVAIGRWFERNAERLWPDKLGLSEAQKQDFLKWEGNAQAFRLLTRLQVTKGSFGLDLTFASLASLMKYTVDSMSTEKGGHPAKKKFGYFQQDAEHAQAVLDAVGLSKGRRHPIAYIMEACDDIAYSVIDVEDAIKKQLISINDILVCIRGAGNAFRELADVIEAKVLELREEKRPPAEVNDIGAQYYRTFSINRMIVAVRQTFLDNVSEICDGSFGQSLTKASEISELCEALKSLARAHAYNSPKVKELELLGDNTIGALLDYFWKGISECGYPGSMDDAVFETLAAPSRTPFGEFVYSHISTNYRARFEQKVATCEVGEFRYGQLLLLTDMVSGMTEDFALDLVRKFRKLDNDRHPGDI